MECTHGEEGGGCASRQMEPAQKKEKRRTFEGVAGLGHLG